MGLFVTNNVSEYVGSSNLNNSCALSIIGHCNPIIEPDALSDWEIKMGKIDAEIQQTAYEKYPVEMSGPEPPTYVMGICFMPYDKNAKKREKLIKELTRQYREDNPEYDAYRYRKEQKEKEIIIRMDTIM